VKVFIVIEHFSSVVLVTKWECINIIH